MINSETISGIVTIDSNVEIVTSSEASVSSPPYLEAKRPRLVAVGRAWISAQTIMTADGKLSAERSAQVSSGPRIS